jgi:hypothetical protein
VPTLLTNLTKSNNNNNNSSNSTSSAGGGGGGTHNDASLTTPKNLAFIDADGLDEIESIGVVSENVVVPCLNTIVSLSVPQTNKNKASNNDLTMISPVNFNVDNSKLVKEENSNSIKESKDSTILDNTLLRSSNSDVNNKNSTQNDADKDATGSIKLLKTSDTTTSTSSAHSKNTNTNKKHKLNLILNRTLSDSILNKKSSSSSNFRAQYNVNNNFNNSIINNNNNNNNTLTVNNSNFSSRVRKCEINSILKSNYPTGEENDPIVIFIFNYIGNSSCQS